jgi:3-oxoacyl-[acyl-carrier protein] reductase
MDDDTRQALLPRQPLGRLGAPTDIADVVAFLVSESGRWVSGQLLLIDGGFSPRC